MNHHVTGNIRDLNFHEIILKQDEQKKVIEEEPLI